MKKFRVEIDGEEFIVNIEEIDSVNSSRKTQNNNSAAGNKGSKTTQQTKVKKNSAKAEKQPQEEAKKASDVGEGAVAAPMPGSILEINVKKV